MASAVMWPSVELEADGGETTPLPLWSTKTTSGLLRNSFQVAFVPCWQIGVPSSAGSTWTKVELRSPQLFQRLGHEFDDLVGAHNANVIVRHQGKGATAFSRSALQHNGSSPGDGEGAAGDDAVAFIQNGIAQLLVFQDFNSRGKPCLGKLRGHHHLALSAGGDCRSNDLRQLDFG